MFNKVPKCANRCKIAAMKYFQVKQKCAQILKSLIKENVINKSLIIREEISLEIL